MASGTGGNPMHLKYTGKAYDPNENYVLKDQSGKNIGGDLNSETMNMMGGQSLMGGGQQPPQGGLMGGGTVANMISNMGANQGMMGGDLNSFMQAPMQAPPQGGMGMSQQPAQPMQQPVDTGSVAYMNNQQQQQIGQGQQSGPTDFMAYANSVRPPPPPPVTAEEDEERKRQEEAIKQRDERMEQMLM